MELKMWFAFGGNEYETVFVMRAAMQNCNLVRYPDIVEEVPIFEYTVGRRLRRSDKDDLRVEPSHSSI